MTPRESGKTVYVAMSGGVDSSVAAHLLVKRGFRVVGVYMKPWQPAGMHCLWEEERADALRVASALNIPLKTWDFSREYYRHVTKPMIRDYANGLTPNPDVECNRHIKFGLFYQRALREGADFVATGHYARISTRQGITMLRTARDTSKDQTYFLWGIKGTQLARILFPVGGLLKKEVRAIARRAALPTADKKDSQGVCFVGQMDMKSFLATAIAPKQGVIRHTDGRVLGAHDGAGYYTIGQRHGLDITDGHGPYFVTAKNMKRNEITVGTELALYRRTARIGRVHWIANDGTRDRLSAKIRYRAPTVPVKIQEGTLAFARPVRAIAPGQSVVFYRGSRVLGGALMR